MVGRYTKDDVEAVLVALEKGATFTAACRAAGVSLAGMKKHADNHPEVKKRIDASRARARKKVETAVFDAATTTDKHGRIDVRAAELWLTNCFPDEWRHRRDISITTAPENAEEIRRAREELSPEAQQAHQQVAHDEIIRRGKEEEEKRKLH